MTTDREIAEAHAQAYHEAVFEASADGFAPDYHVYSWTNLPPANRQLLCEASLIFLSTGKMVEAERRLGLVREAVTKLEMARSDDPYMKVGPLLTVLAEFVEGVEGAIND